VHALPLAAGINLGGHFKWHFFLSLSSGLIANSPRKGCCFAILRGLLSNKNIRIPTKK
jgi:hypothetical protein